MRLSEEKVKGFLEAVRASGLAQDLTKAARHHSAANVAEATRILEKSGKSILNKNEAESEQASAI